MEKPNSVNVYGYNNIGAVNSTDRINFSNQQLYSTVRLDTLQYSLKDSVSRRSTRQVTQMFTYLLTHYSCLVSALGDT